MEDSVKTILELTTLGDHERVFDHQSLVRVQEYVTKNGFSEDSTIGDLKIKIGNVKSKKGWVYTIHSPHPHVTAFTYGYTLAHHDVKEKSLQVRVRHLIHGHRGTRHKYLFKVENPEFNYCYIEDMRVVMVSDVELPAANLVECHHNFFPNILVKVPEEDQVFMGTIITKEMIKCRVMNIEFEVNGVKLMTTPDYFCWRIYSENSLEVMNLESYIESELRKIELLPGETLPMNSFSTLTSGIRSVLYASAVDGSIISAQRYSTNVQNQGCSKLVNKGGVLIKEDKFEYRIEDGGKVYYNLCTEARSKFSPNFFYHIENVLWLPDLGIVKKSHNVFEHPSSVKAILYNLTDDKGEAVSMGCEATPIFSSVTFYSMFVDDAREKYNEYIEGYGEDYSRALYEYELNPPHKLSDVDVPVECFQKIFGTPIVNLDNNLSVLKNFYMEDLIDIITIAKKKNVYFYEMYEDPTKTGHAGDEMGVRGMVTGGARHCVLRSSEMNSMSNFVYGDFIRFRVFDRPKAKCPQIVPVFQKIYSIDAKVYLGYRNVSSGEFQITEKKDLVYKDLGGQSTLVRKKKMERLEVDCDTDVASFYKFTWADFDYWAIFSAWFKSVSGHEIFFEGLFFPLDTCFLGLLPFSKGVVGKMFIRLLKNLGCRTEAEDFPHEKIPAYAFPYH